MGHRDLLVTHNLSDGEHYDCRPHPRGSVRRASGFVLTGHSEVIVVTRRLQCAVKGTGPQREINPPGNWIAPPGSNRSGGGGNKAVGASGVESRIRRLGESAGCNVSER